MALDDDIRTLSDVELLEGFTQEQLRLLAFGAENLRLAAGRVLYREGQSAESGYVVTRGTVALYRERDGDRITLAEVGPGAMLGELAIIAPTTRLTGAAAVTDVELIRLNRTLFRRILTEYPETAALLHARITNNLGRLLADIQTLAPRFSE
ncbi:MAG: cyclic nucleotide-binding domain-containing protein [Aliihoeflea sp.]